MGPLDQIMDGPLKLTGTTTTGYTKKPLINGPKSPSTRAHITPHDGVIPHSRA